MFILVPQIIFMNRQYLVPTFALNVPTGRRLRSRRRRRLKRRHRSRRRLRSEKRPCAKKWFKLQDGSPSVRQELCLPPPWGDCREIGLFELVDHSKDLHHLLMLMSHPNELAKRQKNAEKRAKKAEKERAREEANRWLLKDEVEKKKAEGKFEGRSKCKHDPSTAASKRKSAPKKKTAATTDEFAMSDSSDKDDPPLTKDEVDATLSEQVNITTSTVLPDLRVPSKI